MTQFILMRRLPENVANDFRSNSVGDFTNRPQEWLNAPATGTGLIEILEEVEKRTRATAGGNNDRWHGEITEYFVTCEGREILNPDDLNSLLDLYVELRGTQDEDFVIDYFTKRDADLH